MSAPPFFHSAGRGDLKFWGEDDRPTVVVGESLSESDQEQWSEMMGNSKDWVVWCRSRKKDEEMQKKSSQTAASKPNPKQENRQIRKEAQGSQFAGKCGGDRATSNARRAKSMPHAGFTKIAMWQTSKSSVEESGRSISRKRRVSSAIERERTRLLDGHRGRHAWRL